MSDLAGLIKLYESAVIDVQNIRYCGLAATSLVIYEYFTTLDQEIELVWTSRWSLGKLLFFINRYYILLWELIYFNYGIFSPHISDQFCLNWFRWGGSSGVATFAVAQLILQLRLYALYGKSKKILALMIFSFLAAITASSTILGLSLANVTVPSHVIPGLPFCVPNGDFHLFWTFWIPVVASDSFLCGLAVYRGFRLHRLQGTLFRSRNHLIEFFIRDSVLYFIVVFAVYLGNTITFALAPEPVWECTALFCVVITSCLVNRLILNVREMLQSNTPIVNRPQAPTFPSTIPSQRQSSEPYSTMLSETTMSASQEPHQWDNRVMDIQVGLTDSAYPSEYEMNDIEKGKSGHQGTSSLSR